MLGNVWEWCADGMRFYTAKPVTDPLGPAEAGAERVLRGGSWSSHARFVRSAYRYALDLGIRNDGVGFRCAQVQEGRESGQEPDAEEKRWRPGSEQAAGGSGVTAARITGRSARQESGWLHGRVTAPGRAGRA